MSGEALSTFLQDELKWPANASLAHNLAHNLAHHQASHPLLLPAMTIAGNATVLPSPGLRRALADDGSTTAQMTLSLWLVDCVLRIA